MLDRGGRKSGREGWLWLRKIMDLVCSRNWMAVAISDAEGWWAKIIV